MTKIDDRVRLRVCAWIVVGTVFVWGMAPVLVLCAYPYGWRLAGVAMPLAIVALLFGTLYAPQNLAKKLLAGTVAAFLVTTVIGWAMVQAQWSHVSPREDPKLSGFRRQFADVSMGKLPVDRDGNYLFPLLLDHAPALASDQVRFGMTKDREVALLRWKANAKPLLDRQSDLRYFMPYSGTRVVVRQYGPIYYAEIALISVLLNLAVLAMTKRRRKAPMVVGGAA